MRGVCASGYVMCAAALAPKSEAHRLRSSSGISSTTSFASIFCRSSCGAQAPREQSTPSHCERASLSYLQAFSRLALALALRNAFALLRFLQQVQRVSERISLCPAGARFPRSADRLSSMAYRTESPAVR